MQTRSEMACNKTV